MPGPYKCCVLAGNDYEVLLYTYLVVLHSILRLRQPLCAMYALCKQPPRPLASVTSACCTRASWQALGSVSRYILLHST